LAQREPPRRIGLSATIGDPQLVGAWLAADSRRNVRLIEEDAGRRRIFLGLEHFVLPEEGEDPSLYDHMAELVNGLPKTLVFVNTRSSSEEVVYNLKRRQRNKRAIAIHAHHGNVAAALRETAEADMRDQSRHSCVAATVTLELGIDIGALDQVLQLNTTSSVSSLVQRLGRSGRRGNPPRMFLYSTEDSPTPKSHPVHRLPWRLLQAVAIVQLFHEERWVEPPHIPALPTSLMVQQTLSILAASHALQPRELAQRVLTLAPFNRVTTEQFRLLLQHMLTLEVIEKSATGELLTGRKGEQLVNNWRFYATFETPQEYTVQDESRDIGSLQEMPPVETVFRLAGRAWKVTELDPERRIIFVRPVRGRALPLWQGSGPPIHRRIAQRVRQVLMEDTRFIWLQPNAQERLAAARQLARSSRLLETCLHDAGGGRCLLLPWSGTREVNTLLRILGRNGLEARETVRPYALEVIGSGSKKVWRQIGGILANPPDAMRLSSSVPAPELQRNKFDRYVPEALLRAAWAADVLDVQGACRILEDCVQRRQRSA